MPLNHYQLCDLLQARTVAELYVKAKVACHSLGFEHFLYGARLHVGPGEAHEFVISGYPVAWRCLYEQNGYVNSDPTVAHCLSSGLPLVWSPELFIQGGASELMEHAHQYGLRHGLTVPLHSSSLQTGLFSVACEEPLGDKDLVRVAHCQLLASYLHEAASKLVQKNARIHQTGCQLTGRERECLTWAAAGKSSWDISQILSTSERTVNFHIGNVIHKLQVTSRSHAVAKALARGLIQL